MVARFSIPVIAVALFVLIAVMPVSAATNGSQIDLGATVFIGEEGLNLTHALNDAVSAGQPSTEQTPGNLSLGWWASAAAITTSAPTRTINLAGRYTNFQVSPSDFVGYTGNWYLLKADGTTAQLGRSNTNPVAVINVQDPTLEVAVWNFVSGSSVTGKFVPQGTHLGIQIKTNLYAATYANRNNTVYNMSAIAVERYGGALGFMPDGTTSAWDMNSSTSGNESVTGTRVESTVNANVLKVTNWSTKYATTYGTYGSWITVYYNKSAPATSSESSLPYTAKNYTSDVNGVRRLETATWAPYRTTNVPTTQLTPNAATDGFIDLKVKDASGATINKLYTGATGGANIATLTATPLTGQFVNVQPYWFGALSNFWVTDAVDFNNQYAYPVGTYTISAESGLNRMKDNYRNSGADYTGKTVSAPGTVTLISSSLRQVVNKDSVVFTKPFSITVTGEPNTDYFMWVKGTSSMTGGYDNAPPMINVNQKSVTLDDPLEASFGSHPVGDYQYENGRGGTNTIYNDVATDSEAAAGLNWNRTRYYALVTMDEDGSGTFEWVTNNWTKPQKYTIRIEQQFPTGAYGTGTYKSDEVEVTIEKGEVTIVAAGDQSYYLGEEIKFSGTNTDSHKTYLFIMGPNLPVNGANIQTNNPRANAVADGNAATFKVVDVIGDNTWSWKWGTSTIALDAGVYTVYAVSQPRDNLGNHLENAAYGSVSIIIKKPFVSATASQSTVAQGDRFFITGTAEGNPRSVLIWILGKNYPTTAASIRTEAVNSDASFKYEITQGTTRNLYPGQYFVVVQHPMQNNQYDVQMCTDNVHVCNLQLTNAGSQQIFTLLGAGSLQGSDAAEALVQGINDPNVDDTYTKFQFLIEVPLIRIDPIGDRSVGQTFTVTAQTNLAVDDDILVQVYSTSFKPTQKSQSGEFSGATGTVKVTKGDAGMNRISFDVDTSTFKADEYLVVESAVIQTATGTAIFNVLDGSAPVPTPTPPRTVTIVRTAAPVMTARAPVDTPAAPAEVPTTESPGYGVLIALIGIGAGAFIVMRRQ